MSIEMMKEKMIDDAQNRKAIRDEREKKVQKSIDSRNEVVRQKELSKLKEKLLRLKKVNVFLALAVIFWTVIGTVGGFLLGANQVERFFNPLITDFDKFLAFLIYAFSALCLGGFSFILSNIRRKENLKSIDQIRTKIKKLERESQEFKEKYL